ncbi:MULTISPECIES: peroxiredoxin [unclassified Sphingobacterium]|uniref:peroxiredoxin family protein n=1 Tax=unclassified Sphingobacterium TaxID=2609468 RepID=UPI001052CCFF|nr:MULTISPECIES: TlpA disulfide reductase family protein [unclassified Sphingobacterium]MCS3553153.1 thiol-disulfide isomerase/thioredoxin [Sphingobacterium sp. JUb21]TCR09637.1 thiol-disulfide isomerase/thioredoxin [Sphingobacterium sp. JUb20]
MINFIRDGRVHAYLEGIFQSIFTIKTICSRTEILSKYPTTKNALKNNIAQATHVDLKLRLYYGESSVILWGSIVPDSGMDCHSLGYLLLNNQIISKEIAIKQQRISKQSAMQTLWRSLGIQTKAPRNGNESVMKHQLNSNESVTNNQKDSRETAINRLTKTIANRSRINSGFFLTKLTPTSNFLRVRFDLASGFHRPQCMKSRSQVEEKSSKGRSWLGKGINLIFQLFTIATLLIYRRGTVKLPRVYQNGTGNVLESYQRATKSSSLTADIQTANSKDSEFNRYSKKVVSQKRAFKMFKFLRWVKVWFYNINVSSSLKYFLSQMQRDVMDVVNMSAMYKELKTARAILLLTLTVFQNFNFSLTVLKNIRTYSLLVLMFHMFSLSAQTPRKDSGADGPIKIQPLKIGDSIPEAVWSMPLQIVNHPEGNDTITLNDYRDKKLIVLDFWAIWCAPCIKSIIYIDSLITEIDSDQIALLPINRYDNKARMQSFINKVDWPFPSVINNKMLDEILMSSYRDYLGVVWILDQKLFAVPRKESITIENLESLLCDQYDNLNLVNYPPIIRTKQ